MVEHPGSNGTAGPLAQASKMAKSTGPTSPLPSMSTWSVQKPGATVPPVPV